MQVNVDFPQSIFEKKMTLEVPVFQRQYAWTQERQWEPLWEDIAYKFTHYLSEENRPGHFLGAIILAHVDTASTHVQKGQIIDGQQRLITMQIFISAFGDFCREQGILALAAECEKYTRNTGWGVDKETRFKVYPKKPDREQFEDVIFSESKAEIERKHRSKPRPLIIEAYLFFYSQISEFFKISEEAREKSIENRLEKCFNAISRGLQVVTIDLNKEDDPQVIYESLNARGEPLSFADLIRNDIFLRIRGDREELYERYWEPLEEKLLPKGKMDQFMYCYLTSKMGIYIPKRVKRMYYEYKNWIGGRDSLETEIKAIHRSGGYFHDLIEPQRGKQFYKIAVFLKLSGIEAVYPFLLAVMEQHFDEEKETQKKETQKKETQERISTIIESYLIRRHICRQDSRGYNRLFVELTRKLRSGFSTDRIADQIAEFFLGKEGSSNEWPSDAKFKEAWIATPMDMLKYLEYILKMLNESYRSSMSEESDRDRKLTREYILPQQWIDRKLTREHILPQQWIDHWPLPNGENGLSEEERADATEKRNAALHTIGNLTILTQELNASVSNGPWKGKKGKKEAICKQSILPINTYFQDIEEWNEEQIAIRSEKLFQKALELWPRG
ncbi:MAG: DUF262 domain-containing protein [Nitrospira sp.]|nr:DUF262 domain-containing protein [Nitrospira sp.]